MGTGDGVPDVVGVGVGVAGTGDAGRDVVAGGVDAGVRRGDVAGAGTTGVPAAGGGMGRT